jgi:hypothetical protein
MNCARRYSQLRANRRKPRRRKEESPTGDGGASINNSLSRALARALEVAEVAAEPDKSPSPGSPNHPGTSALPAAEVAAAGVAEVAAAAPHD